MRLLLPILLLLVVVAGHGQISVSTNTNANALAQKIVGQGVTIMNAQFTGSSLCAGFFVDSKGVIGIDSGIVLTNGRAKTTGNNYGVDGAATSLANSSFPNGSSGINGYPLLTSQLPGSAIGRDACVLEFDFIPQGDSINVRFVFGSEEYPDFVCTPSNYNDVFAFFVSGPGITGEQNIALIPGTTTPVSINAINLLPNCNGNPTYPQYYVSNTGSSSFTYGGRTTVLIAQCKVQPCQTYHIKLAIEDIGDDQYDSGVFLQASSFSSNSITANSIGGFTDAQNNTVVVEGCKSSQVKLKLGNPPSSPLTLPLAYSGTATFGVDYAPLPSSVQFGINETEKVLDIVPLMDNQVEPTETIIISIGSNACSGSSASSVTVLIKDSLAFGNVKDTFVCSKFPTVLTAPRNDTTMNKYTWSNGDTARQTSVALPGNNYWVIHRFANNCYNVDTFHVVNGDPMVTVGNDVSFCNKDSLLVTANALPVGGSYLWNTNETTAAIYVKSSGNYSATYTAPNGCYLSDDLQATAKPLPYANLGNDTSLCSYESLLLNAFYPGATYLWSNAATTSSIVVTDAGQYIVTSNLNGCEVRDTIVVSRKTTPIANAGTDTTILAGGTAKLVALQDANNSKYEWWPTIYFNYPNAYNPYASPSATDFVYLKVTSKDNCVALDTLQITVLDYQLAIPNAFSPNGDGVNDTWDIRLLNSYIFSRIQVFNRYGQMVFSSVGYDKAWDGKQNGKPLPVGTYYYVVEPGMGKPVKSGSVTILK